MQTGQQCEESTKVAPVFKKSDCLSSGILREMNAGLQEHASIDFYRTNDFTRYVQVSVSFIATAHCMKLHYILHGIA